MKILENMEEILSTSKYYKKNIYDNDMLNNYINYCKFLEEKEEFLYNVLYITLETILYPKYFWYFKYKELYFELYGTDVSIEQQQYKILGEIENRLEDNINWSFIQLIEEGVV